MPGGKTIAIIGASTDRKKFSNKAVRAYVQQGWEVYPINPEGEEVEGLTAYASLGGVPAKLDRVSLYVSPGVGVELLPEIAAANPHELFINPGAESDELVVEARGLGLDPIFACSIVDIGASPAEFSG